MDTVQKGLKIILTRFGGGVSSIVSEQESSSNASIIEAPALKLLIEELGAHIYICGPIQTETKKILNNKEHPNWKPYLENFTICDLNTEPVDPDLIWVSSGSDNLRLTGKYNGLHAPCALHVYRILAKYPNAKVVYFQTDFAAPFWHSGEGYGALYKHLYNSRRLWQGRSMNALCAGTSDVPYLKHHWIYRWPSIVKLHFFPPDLHFLIDLDDLSYKFEKPADRLTGIAFAGKQRIVGSRHGVIQDYLEQSIPFVLGGRWKPETVKQFEESNPLFKYIGKLGSHEEVLKFYNQLGATLFISAPEYNSGGIVTSRMYDAIHSKAIPFIHERDYPNVAKQFGDFPELIVNPRTLGGTIMKFRDPIYRENVINQLKSRYYKNQLRVREAFIQKIQTIMEYDEGPTEGDIKKECDELMKFRYKYVRNKPPTVEDYVQKMRNEYGMTINEVLNKEVKKSKMQMGMFLSDFPDKESMDDVPVGDLSIMLGYMRN